MVTFYEVDFNFQEKIASSYPFFSNTMFVRGVKKDGVSGFIRIYQLDRKKMQYEVIQILEHKFDTEWLTLS